MERSKRQENAWQSYVIASLAAVMALWIVGCGPSYPKCDDDSNCHQGEFCVDGMCQMCRSGTDCPAGQDCNGGRCEPISGYCQSGSDCPGGQECQNNRCTTVTQSGGEIDAPTTTGPTGPCRLETVYFDFDSNTLSDQARATMQANANCIRERNIARVTITGHCDQRGTEEYNLALGDRRARSAMQYLVSLGVAQRSLTAASMGEEMAQGEDDASMVRDRRVDFSEQ